MQLTTCPSSEQLSDYLSGKLSAQEIDEISSHIESCVDCDTAVNKLDDDSDSLMFALRQPLGEELFEQEPELQRAVAAMRLSLPESESQNSCTVLGTVREYDLLEKIGQGGMGTVYKALHSRLKRIVALKVLADHRLGDPAAVDRFSREMQAVGKLAHPNIVRALDAGEAEGRHYLVMEYIDGIDLSRLSRRCGPLPVAEASELVLQVSLALQHAHEHGLVHRDIKPSNVMLTRDGNVKLLDLGIALLQPDEPATSDLTGTGQVMGTLDYMAPEQLDNTHAVDIRADVYGLGATLYKLLCGSAPATDSQSRFRLPGESIPPVPNIRTIRGDIPKPVAAVIQRMLAPNPDQRYATPADVAEALKPFAAKSNLKQLALAAAADAPSRTMTPPKRFGGRLGRFVIAAAALLGMTLAGFAIYVETDKGQIVIHSNVDDVQVLVKRTGKLYDALDELEVDKGDNQWKFRSGSYEVQLLGKTDGLRVKDGVFTLTRDGKAVVTIERDPARAKAVVSGPVYEGKTLEEWLELLLMEKSVPQRSKAIPGITVLGIDAPDKAIAALFKVGVENDSSTSHYNNKSYLQKETIQAIQKLSPDKIPSILLDALQDSDVKKRRYAAQYIRHHWDNDPPITLVRTAAKDPDEYVRRDAVGWLAQYGSVAIPDLIVALDDESDKVRRAAVSAVSLMASYYKTLTPEDARILEPKIYDMVDDKSAKVRESILWALRSVASDDQKLLAVLEAALHDPVPEVQVAAIGVLRTLGPKAAAAVPALTVALKSRNRKKVAPIITSGGSELSFTEPIPAKLIRALGSIGPNAKSGVPVIKEFLQHEHKDVRNAVVEAIQQITGEDIELPQDDKTPGNKTAKGPVYGDKTLDEWIALLKTQRSAAARHTAVEPIETLGVDEPEKAIAALIEAGSDYDPRNLEQFEPWFEPRSIWIAINSAIKRLSPSQIPVGVVEALADEDIKKRRFATSLIEQYKDVVPPIEAAEKAAADSDEYVRSQTLEWVDRYDGEAIPILIAAFNDQSEQVRRRAAAVASRLATSGNTSPEDAKLIAPKLYEMLHDKDAQIRADSLTALSRFAFDQDKLLTELIEAVGDSDPKVKSIAIQSLGALGPKAEPAVSVLVASLKQCSRKTLKPKDILTMYSVTHAFRDIAPERLIVALGSIGPSAQSAVPTIKEFLKHDDVYVRNAVVEAIQQITGEVIELPKDNKTAVTGPVYDGKTFDEWVTLLKNDKSPQRQIEGIKALVALGTAENASRALEIVFEMGASHSIERQNDDDREVVSAALEAIARINDAKLVRPFLLGKLDSEDAGARLFAITVLNYPLASGRDPNYSEKTLARIYAMSGDPAVRVRLKLIELLGRLASFAKNGESPVPTLIKMYETDKDQQVRYAAFHSLAALGDKRAHAAFPLFLDALSSPDGTIRKYAVGALEESKPDPKLLNEALIKAIESQEEAVRRSAIEFVDFLMRTRQPTSAELLPALIVGLKSKDVNVQHGTRIVMPLLIRFPQEVIPTLISELDSAHGETKERIVLALVRYNRSVLALVRHNRSGENGSTEATDILELERLYQTADANRRANIIRVFGEIGPGAKSALPLVEEALKDKDPQVRAAAEAAIKAIRSKSRKTDSPPAPKTSGPVYDGRTFDEWVTLLKTDRSAHRQLEGIKALASLRSDENTPLVVSTIIKIAGDGDRISTGKNDPNVAESAEAILRQIGQEAAVPQLLTTLESDDVTMRRFAVNALDRFEITEEVAPAILKLPEDDDIQVRLASTRLLRQAGEPGVAALAKMVEEDKSDGVRARAANSLAVLEDKAHSAVPALLDALSNDDMHVQMAVQLALRQIKPDQKLLNNTLLKLVADDAPISIRVSPLGPFGLVDENSTATLPAHDRRDGG